MKPGGEERVRFELEGIQKAKIIRDLIRSGLSADLDHLSFIKDKFPEELTIPGNQPSAVPIAGIIFTLTAPGAGKLIPAGFNPFAVPDHLFLSVQIPLPLLEPLPVILTKLSYQSLLTLIGNNPERPDRFTRPDIQPDKNDSDYERDNQSP